MSREKRAWALFWGTRAAGALVDSAIIGFAYLSAFVLRFDFQEPRWG